MTQTLAPTHRYVPRRPGRRALTAALPLDFCETALGAVWRATADRAERRRVPAAAAAVSIHRAYLLAGFRQRGYDPLLQYPMGEWDLDFYFPAEGVCVEVGWPQHAQS